MVPEKYEKYSARTCSPSPHSFHYLTTFQKASCVCSLGLSQKQNEKKTCLPCGELLLELLIGFLLHSFPVFRRRTVRGTTGTGWNPAAFGYIVVLVVVVFLLLVLQGKMKENILDRRKRGYGIPGMIKRVEMKQDIRK